eukprot:GFKZ01011553.1.p4 GENE.GFKZ01011553.1~~GFKZ01011553.1.p4  ORF type:complete len:115 (+),score=14.42 GFKZ01011553.1:764-1108(+)
MKPFDPTLMYAEVDQLNMCPIDSEDRLRVCGGGIGGWVGCLGQGVSGGAGGGGGAVGGGAGFDCGSRVAYWTGVVCVEPEVDAVLMEEVFACWEETEGDSGVVVFLADGTGGEG